MNKCRIIAVIMAAGVVGLVQSSNGKTAEEITQGLSVIMTGVEVEKAKAALFNGITDDKQFEVLCAAATPNDQDLLKILWYTKQAVSIGETDASLGYEFEGNKVVKKVTMLFDSDKVKDRFVCLERYDAKQLKGIVNAIVNAPFVGSYLPEGAPGTTWSSTRLKTAVQNIRMAELAKRSATVRLLAESSGALPKNAEAIFDWSHDKTVTIDLKLPAWGSWDVPALTRISQGQDAFFAAAAKKTLENIGK